MLVKTFPKGLTNVVAIASTIALALLLACFGISPKPLAAAASIPKMTLSQTVNLHDKQFITLHGSGYKPNYNLYLAETVAKPTSGIPQTYTSELKLKTDSHGNFTTKIKASKHIDKVNCLTSECYIASFAAWPNIFTDHSQDVWVPIKFSNSLVANKVPAKLVSSPNSPQVTVSKKVNLNPNGEYVTVRGTGFSGKEPGLYVGLAAINNFSATDASHFSPDTKWIRAKQIKNGAWSTVLKVKAQFNHTNCYKTACAIYTLMAHGSSDRSQDTKTYIMFNPALAKVPAKATKITTLAEVNPVAKPQVTLSKTTGINPQGEEVTVRGTGFSGAGAGIYVTLGLSNKFSHTDASVYAPSQLWIRPNQMHAGTWEGKINLTSKFGENDKYDCLKEACSVFTFAAHGSSDRSQDTNTPIKFATTDSKDTKNSTAIFIISTLAVIVIAGAGIMLTRRKSNSSK